MTAQIGSQIVNQAALTGKPTMPVNDQEITIEIEGLRSKDMQSVKEAYQKLEQMLSDATLARQEEINKALAWARSVYGEELG
jgi:hypothetical protein